MFYLVRYGEIGLKGLNRNFFENKLVKNIKSAIARKTENFNILKKQGRIIVEADKDISGLLKKIFGIVNFSAAEKADSYEELKNLVLESLKTKDFNSFRITANRVNKDFPKTSDETARELGAFVVENFNKKVNLKNFDLNVNVEIIDRFYLFFEKIKGLGGLPVGVEGKVVCLVENEEGFAAAFLAMKRGCEVVCAGSNDFDVSRLSLFSPKNINFIKIKSFEEIKNIAREEKAIVVQDRIESIKDYETDIFIMRPLIALENEEIKNILEVIMLSD